MDAATAAEEHKVSVKKPTSSASLRKRASDAKPLQERLERIQMSRLMESNPYYVKYSKQLEAELDKYEIESKKTQISGSLNVHHQEAQVSALVEVDAVDFRLSSGQLDKKVIREALEKKLPDPSAPPFNVFFLDVEQSRRLTLVTPFVQFSAGVADAIYYLVTFHKASISVTLCREGHCNNSLIDITKHDRFQISLPRQGTFTSVSQSLWRMTKGTLDGVSDKLAWALGERKNKQQQASTPAADTEPPPFQLGDLTRFLNHPPSLADLSIPDDDDWSVPLRCFLTFTVSSQSTDVVSKKLLNIGDIRNDGKIYLPFLSHTIEQRRLHRVISTRTPDSIELDRYRMKEMITCTVRNESFLDSGICPDLRSDLFPVGGPNSPGSQLDSKFGSLQLFYPQLDASLQEVETINTQQEFIPYLGTLSDPAKAEVLRRYV